MNKVLLHVGCANTCYPGFINCDMNTESSRGVKYEKLDEVFDLSKTWPHENESVDGIVGMSVFQQLHWRELIFAFRESFRVLKKGGALRMGVTLIEGGKPIDHILGWNNVNVFSCEILVTVLKDHIGYSTCKLCNKGYTAIPEFVQVDNRSEHTYYIEAIK